MNKILAKKRITDYIKNKKTVKDSKPSKKVVKKPTHKKPLTKDAHYDIDFDKIEEEFGVDKAYLQSALDEAGISLTPEEVCFQLTAYENGSIDYDEGMCALLRDDDVITNSDYSDYMNETYPDDVWIDMDEFDDYLRDEDPSEIARKIHFGNFNITNNYFRFDAYNNLESTDHPEDDYNLEDKNFIEWYIDNSNFDIFTNNDIKEAFVEGTYQLIKQGY